MMHVLRRPLWTSTKFKQATSFTARRQSRLRIWMLLRRLAVIATLCTWTKVSLGAHTFNAALYTACSSRTMYPRWLECGVLGQVRFGASKVSAGTLLFLFTTEC